MSSQSQVIELLKGSASILQGESSYLELSKLCKHISLEQAFQFCREGMNRLSEMERFDVWHHARKNQDRLAGILCVAELRMPCLPVFGPLTLTMGDTLSDYDRARTFILQNWTTGEFIPNFYPEIATLPPRKRVISLAQSHIGCTPKGQRQTNLFAICGYNELEYARATTTPSGTTCGLFMRAILKAAGDSRITSDMLPRIQTDMHKAMGVQTSFVKNGIPPFYSGLWLKGKIPTPKSGDLYHTQIPATALHGNKSKQDSGHVGFVLDATRLGDSVLNFKTIDGGIAGADGNGFLTAAGILQLVRNNAGFWETKNKLNVMGEARILVGFVDLDQVAACFVRENYYSLDGRSIDAHYPS